MTDRTSLPTSPDDQLAYLQSAVRLGKEIQQLLVIGEPAGRLRDYAAATPELSVLDTPEGLVLKLGDHVEWHVTLDDLGQILGFGSSGYRDLMAALGMDLGGHRFDPAAGGD